ncbi:MAG TPA: metallophosphoesterase [Reyranella sp.]|nr:metallophosphoesterase [Reyranella sp.]
MKEGWAERRRAIATSRYWVSPAGPRTRWRKAIFNRLLALLALLLRLTPLHRRGVANALALRRVELDIAIPGLPQPFDGYRILQLSDTHLDVMPPLAEAARELLAGVEVDMLALTGDIYGHPPHAIEQSADLLMQALAEVRVTGPRFAILGNHDPVEMVDLLAARGFEVLVNTSRFVERGDGRLRVTGLDDVHSFYTDSAREALAMPGEGGIALVHSAELADVAEAAGYNLYLAGHTHGGQICLPGGQPVVTQLVRCKHAAVGLWRQGRMIGYTSSGLGVSDPPVRFNCRGEVTILTLRRA